jgi:hypothetical protein
MVVDWGEGEDYSVIYCFDEIGNLFLSSVPKQRASILEGITPGIDKSIRDSDRISEKSDRVSSTD